jgi:hypothetical protein
MGVGCPHQWPASRHLHDLSFTVGRRLSEQLNTDGLDVQVIHIHGQR